MVLEIFTERGKQFSLRTFPVGSPFWRGARAGLGAPQKFKASCIAFLLADEKTKPSTKMSKATETLHANAPFNFVISERGICTLLLGENVFSIAFYEPKLITPHPL